MSKYVIDAYAWIEYVIGSEAGKKVATVLEEESNEIYTSAVTVAEVISKVAREGKNIEAAYNVLVSNSQIIDIDEEISRDTGLLHAEMRKTKRDFGLADAYVLATARRIRSKIMTGDRHFDGVREAILL